MRISDWSSDVCSSDLGNGLDTFFCGAGSFGHGATRNARLDASLDAHAAVGGRTATGSRSMVAAGTVGCVVRTAARRAGPVLEWRAPGMALRDRKSTRLHSSP